MLYTRKGDNGMTRVFNSKPGTRISKSSCQTETLGALDELNSFLGLVKVRVKMYPWSIRKKKCHEIIHWLQDCLFTVQAEVAGANKKITPAKVREMEKSIEEIEKELPKIKSFFISGSSEAVALLDISRTLARKAERRVIAGMERQEFKISRVTLSFLNRLSSLLYVLARLSAHKSGINEESPRYR